MERETDEEPVDPGYLFLERNVNGVGPQRRWALFRVLDLAGTLIGLIVEDHEPLVGAYGPAHYTAVLQGPPSSRWRSHGHPTPAAAFATLCRHLETGG